MKKGLLFVASALLVGSLASCGGSKGPQHKPVTTVSATYTAKYKLDVATTKPGEKAFARDVDDTVTVEADYSKGNLYLHGKRVGREFANEAKSTYEVLLWKDGANYKWLTSTMGNAVTITDEQTAYAKMDALLKKVSFRSGGWIDNSTFTYTDKLGEYEHHHFLLDSTTIPLEDMDKPTVTGDSARKSTFDMKYVGYQTDAGTSELHNDPKGATALVETDDGSRVTKFDLTYNSAWMDMPIGTPAPRLTLTGSRKFSAVYDEAITKLAADKVPHETVTAPIIIKDSYKGGTVKVYGSANGQLTPRKELKNGDPVEVDSWITIEATPATKPTDGTSGIKSVLLDTNAQSLVEGKYVFEAKAKNNEVKVVFTGHEPIAKMLLKFQPNDYFKENTVKMITFNLAGNTFINEKVVTKNTVETDGNLWFALKVKASDVKENVDPDNFDYKVKGPNDAEAKKGTFMNVDDVLYFCAHLKQEGNYELYVSQKAKQPEGEGVKFTAPGAVVGATANIGYFEGGDQNWQQFYTSKITKDTHVPFGATVVVYLDYTDDTLLTDAVVKFGEKVITLSQFGPMQVFKQEITTENYTKDQKVTITITNDNEGLAAKKGKAELVYDKTDDVTAVALQSMIMEGNNPSQITNIEGTTIDCEAKKWAAVKVTAKEGQTIVHVTANGEETMYIKATNQYCFPVSAEGLYTVKIIVSDAAYVNVTGQLGIKATALTSFTLVNNKAGEFAPVGEDHKAPISDTRWVGLKLTVKDGYEIVSVKYNDEDTFFIAGQYCVKTAKVGYYDFVVTTKATKDARISTVVPNESGIKVTYSSYVPATETAEAVITPFEGNRIVAGENVWVAFNIANVPTGKIAVVTSLEDPAVEIISENGVIRFNAKAAKEYVFNVTLQDAPAADQAE